MAEPGQQHDARARAIAAARPRPRAWEGTDFAEAREALRARFVAALNQERERGRFFLWLPVFAVCGVLLFFAAERDPSPWAAAGAFATLCAVVWMARARPSGFPIALALAALALGFLSAALRVERAAAPILERPVRGVATGTVERVEPRSRGYRLVLRVESLGALKPEDLLQQVRVRVTVPKVEGIEAGNRVSVEALWRPPPGSARPGGYDFAQAAFFLRLGAVGSEGRQPVLLDPGALDLGQRVAARIDRLRNAITARIVAVVPGDAGAIAAALVTGQRGEISNAANDAGLLVINCETIMFQSNNLVVSLYPGMSNTTIHN